VRAQLHQPCAAGERRGQPAQKGLLVARVGAGDEIALRQPQGIDDGLIRGREARGVHGLRRQPVERLSFQAPGGAVEGGDEVHVEQHVAVAVVVVDADQRSRGADLDAELLAQLPRERAGDILARLQLAARKLPESALVDAVRSPRDQHPALGVRERAGGDVDLATTGCGSDLRSDTRR